jgi:hypothetical protein
MRAKDVLAHLRPESSRLAAESDQSPLPLYRSQNTHFGSYLIAANLLRYKGAELAPNGHDAELLFYDPDERGLDLLRRYNAGAAELVNARVLYEVRGYLLSEVKRLQAGVRSANQSSR